MELRVLEDEQALARAAAGVVGDHIRAQPDTLVLPATGATPMGCYAELAGLRRADSLDTSRVRIAQLDDYLGLEPGDPRSLFGWMDRALLTPLGIDAARTIRFDTDGVDPELACRAYDAEVKAAGGIDLAILGLGPNGHLGFNEPPSTADATTRAITLTPESIASNAAYWNGGAVPARAVTAGMSIILSARRVVLLVAGARKASVLDRLLRSEPDPWLPASHLREHPDAVVLADAGSRPSGLPPA